MITEKDARARRVKISREADFYGSMDGASKFVRGDAVAGILIVLVNIFGGLIIGIFQQGMAIQVALTNYTLLTIGEGLVAQIPALIISTAAGIIVTRSADEDNFGNEITGQFLNYPKAFYVTSGVMFLFAMIPGLPHFAFLLLSGVTLLAGKMAREKAQVVEEMAALPESTEGEETDDQASTIRPMDVLELEVGYGLVPMVDASQNGELLERIRSIRRQYAQKLGFIVPPIHIHDNLQLKPVRVQPPYPWRPRGRQRTDRTVSGNGFRRGNRRHRRSQDDRTRLWASPRSGSTPRDGMMRSSRLYRC